MSHYRKLIAAIIGVALMLLHRHLGLDLTGLEPVIIDTVIAILTAVGVWAVPNEPPAGEKLP
jgi:hypothetical protein